MDTKTVQSTLQSPISQQLYLAFELSQKQWKLGFTVGMGQRPRIRTIQARDLPALQWEVQEARHRFRLPDTVTTLSCYEAGRDSFWLHRYLHAQGIANLVVDSASIEVSRRSKRAKTDMLDVDKLLEMLIRYHSGERKLWRVVHVPSLEVEDRRHLHRELTTLKAERTRHINRIKGLLVGQGVCMPVIEDLLEKLETVRLWDGTGLPVGIHTRLEREYQRIQLVNQQIQQLEVQREEQLRTSDHPSVVQVRQLLRLKAIGVNSAWLFVMEFFSWRDFHNRREVGALAGLTATPYTSGGASREQGISKAGNRHIRAMIVEIAWIWLRYQPNSQLSRWYQQRFGQGSNRLRRIGIVALARRLLIDLWRYLETGTVPEGAVLKSS
jgi:transposase